MNPEFDSTRQALEARLTALLLGELDPEQARALNEILARDPELSKLHARLKETIELVRETAVEHAGHNASATVPLKLSEQRRQELLQRFKTVTPKEFAEPKKRTLSSRLVFVAAALAMMAMLASSLLPALSKAKSKSRGPLFESARFGSAAPAASSPVTFSAPATPQSPPENDSLPPGGLYAVTAGGEPGLGTIPHVATTPIVLPPVENAAPPPLTVVSKDYAVNLAAIREGANSQAGQAGSFGWQPKPAVAAGGPGGGGAGASSVVMEDVKLRDAIQDLAHKAGREYTFDPTVDWKPGGPDGKVVPEPTVSVHWDNTTPDQALDGLLRNHNLRVVEDPNNKGVGKIVPTGVTTLTGDKVYLFKVDPTKTETAAKPSGGGSVVNFANVAPSPDRTAVSESIRQSDGTVALAYQSPGAGSGMITNIASAASANPSDLELFRSRYGLSHQAPARPNPNQTPANAQTRMQDGKSLFELGRWNEAEVALKSAVEADPNNNQAQYYLNLTKDARLKNELASRERSAQVSLAQTESAFTTPPKSTATPGFGDSAAWVGTLEAPKASDAIEPATRLPAQNSSGNQLLATVSSNQNRALGFDWSLGNVLAGKDTVARPPTIASAESDQLLAKSMRGGREVNGDAAAASLGPEKPKTLPEAAARSGFSLQGPLPGEVAQQSQEFRDQVGRTTDPNTDSFSQKTPLLGDLPMAGSLFRSETSAMDKERGRLDLPNGLVKSFTGVTAGTPVVQTDPDPTALDDTRKGATPERGFLGLTTNYVVTGGSTAKAPVASLNVESLADRIAIAGAGTNSYDRNTYFRNLNVLDDDSGVVANGTLSPDGKAVDHRFYTGVTRGDAASISSAAREAQSVTNVYSGGIVGYTTPKSTSNIVLPGSEPAQLARTEKQVMQYANGRDITPSLEQLARPAETPAPAQSSSVADQLAEKQRQLEELQRFRQLLYLKVASEKIDTELPKTSRVIVVDRAIPPTKSPSLWDKLTGNRPAAVARVKIDRDDSEIAKLGGRKNGSGIYDPYFIQTESEVLKSELVLGKVVDSLGLQNVWGKKDGEPLKTAEAINLLKKKLELKPVNNTHLMEIRVTDENAAESAALANKIAEAYRDYRVEERKKLSMGGMSLLRGEFEEQELKVRKVQEEVDRLRKQLKGSEVAVNSSARPAATPKEPDEPPKARPAVPPPIPQPEIATRDNAWSTFSLNVSDVSFKLAGASLEKGQLPDPASIRSEEFINAFDYRDPEPSAGVPVAFAWERAQYPFAQNRDLLRFSLKTAAQGRQPGRALNIVLLLDNSGSMERADRVQIIREALKVLAAQLQPQDKFSLVTFARTPRLLVDGVPGDQAAPVADEVSGLTPQGGTNLEEAMNLAYQTATRHYLANGVNRVVLLTDGAANLGDVEPESLKKKVEAQRKQGIALDCFGIGWEGFNDDLLEVLSRNGDGRYGFINTPGEAATEFAGQLAGALQVAASDVKVQVEFNPARVTAYRQIGYAKHQLTKEQFRDNTVDAAEIGAAEAGNALYTVEVNPAGEGPLATVRVRYKVPGTSDYREQEWAVPYAGAAPALGQASSAMRLAASASAFSEWLATSPYAGDVNPDQLLAYLTGVPEVYGADTRPKRLEWMIRQAKSLAGK